MEDKAMSTSMADIKNILEPFKKKAWYPITETGEQHKQHSMFSGIPKLLTSESWPCCGHCNQPMQLFVQLDSRELPIAAENPFGEGYLQVFYCTNEVKECDMECEAYFPFANSTLVRVLGFDEKFSSDTITSEVSDALPQKTITGWIIKEDYPSNREFEDLGISLTDEQDELIYDSELEVLANDKLLGWPFWVQGVEYPDCPKCNKPMAYIFQIDSEDNLDFMFGDAGCAHITQCKTHRNQMAIAWACG